MEIVIVLTTVKVGLICIKIDPIIGNIILEKKGHFFMAVVIFAACKVQACVVKAYHCTCACDVHYFLLFINLYSTFLCSIMTFGQ